MSSTRTLRMFACLAFGACALLGDSCTSVPVVQRSPVETVLAADRVMLPTIAISDFLFVEVRINDAGPFFLMVDTGADALFVSPRVATAAKLKPWRGPPVEIAGSIGSSDGNLATVSRLDCGGLALRGLTAAIMSNESLAHLERVLRRKVDGVMGLANFAGVVLEIDFAKRAVAAVRPGTTKYPDARAISYTGLKPVVSLEIAGKRIDCLIDTGSTDNIALPSLHGVPLVFPPEKPDGLGTVGVGTASARYASSQLDGDARLGPIVWHNPPLSAGPKGRIGRTAFALWRIAIDQEKHVITVLDENPVAEWKKDFPSNRRYKPGFFCTIEGTAIRLIEVDPGFAMHRAGLRSGDIVTRIDAMLAADWLLAKYAGKLPPDALRAPRFSAVRNGKSFDVVVQLAPAPGG